MGVAGCGRYDIIVPQVRGKDVLLRFADSFHDTFDNDAYDVMFTFNRLVVGVSRGGAWFITITTARISQLLKLWCVEPCITY